MGVVEKSIIPLILNTFFVLDVITFLLLVRKL